MNYWYLSIFLTIVILAILAKTGWRPAWRKRRNNAPSPITTTGGSSEAPPAQSKSSGCFKFFACGCLLYLFLSLYLVFYVGYAISHSFHGESTTVQHQPSIIYGTTPATITADYYFRIEADGPVLVQYPGEKPVLYNPGRGFVQLPEPNRSGPKVFTDPRDPANGHVGFRLYPVK